MCNKINTKIINLPLYHVFKIFPLFSWLVNESMTMTQVVSVRSDHYVNN
jgi:hypothetical protein